MFKKMKINSIIYLRGSVFMKKNIMKKAVVFTFIAFIMLVFISPVYAADYTCGSLTDVAIDEKIINTISTVIKVIQIVVPILLIIFGMIDLAKGVMAQKEDEIKKGQQTFIKRLIAAAIVFFVITITKMLISFLDGETGCVSCFVDGTGSCTPYKP
jgi:hypothetical protein